MHPKPDHEESPQRAIKQAWKEKVFDSKRRLSNSEQEQSAAWKG
jgi:hypothetical protein